MIMDSEKFIKRQKAREKKEKTIQSYNSRHVWVVEYVYYVDGKKYFKPTDSKIGEHPYFLTRSEALDAKEFNFHGHPKDLRVVKYERVKE